MCSACQRECRNRRIRVMHVYDARGGTNGRWAITRGRAIHILHVNSTLITPAVGNLLPCAPSVNFGDWVLEFKRSISA